ncbi:MAG: glycosyltransferase family 2 protein [Candidatus Buchananbacteria bacterium]|nr:glycosyltransferase family 2 protein [Candidatus Buchananbacteria bacterium]
MNKISIQIVTWNSMRYIFDCLESLMRQNFRDFSVMVIDNGSDDGTVEFVRSNYPTVSILQNFKNFGFSKANNQGIQLSKSEYVLVMNPDVVLADNFLQTIINFAEAHPEAGSFGGKILKMSTEAYDENDQEGLRETVKSNVIDSTGLLVFKSRKVINRGEGQKDQGQFDRTEEVFGLTGACVLYRRTALDEVMVKNEYFDNDFFAYKEDIDLAWRLRLYGFSSWYVPSAICYHHRRLSVTTEHAIKKVMQSRKAVSKMLRQYSFRNHHLMILKNDQWLNIFLALPWFVGREMRIVFYALFFEHFQLKSFVEFFRLAPKMFLKRRITMSHKKVQPREIRRWFI